MIISKRQKKRAKKYALQTINEYKSEIEPESFMEKMHNNYGGIKSLPELEQSLNIMLVSIAIDALAFYRSLPDTILKKRKLEILQSFVNHWMDGQFDKWIVRFFWSNKYLHKMLRMKWFKLVNKANEPDGQKFEVVDHVKNMFYGVNVVRCGVVKFLKKENAMEIGMTICNGDHHIIKHLPKNIEFRRSHVIADGSQYCDFRYFFNKI